MILLHTADRVVKLLRVSQDPAKSKTLMAKGETSERSSYIAPHFEHHHGRRSVFGADSWTTGCVQDIAVAQAAPFALTVSLAVAEGSSSSSQNEASSTYAICFAKRSALLLNGCSFASVGASNAEGSFRTT